MSTASLDRKKYERLLGRASPAVIHDELEYERLQEAVAELIEREDLSIEEGRLLELLALLVEEYEDRVHPLPRGKPHRMLAHLLAERELQPSALWDILPKSRVSGILNGKRGISKDQAKKLGAYFGLPVDLFL